MRISAFRFLKQHAICAIAMIVLFFTSLSALAHATMSHMLPLSSTTKVLSFAGGNGTEANPYQIENVNQLQLIKDYLDSHFILIADIDASATATWNGGAGFEPIGNYDVDTFGGDSFEGSLKGNGHKINGLTINRSSWDYVGLFSHLGYNANVSGLALVDVNIKGTQGAGGLAGINFGAITTSFVTGHVSGDMEVGGLVGGNEDGTITDCYAAVTVSATSYVGGLAGVNFFGTINTSYANGRVLGSSDIGGLVGNDYNGSITSSYWNISTTEQLSGAGNGALGGLTGLSNSQFKKEGNFNGFDFGIWDIGEGKTYPYLRVNRLPDAGPAPLASVLYVNKNVAGGDGSGDSWDNAIPELADALRLARDQWGQDGAGAGWNETNPLQIWVAGGVYKPLYHAADGAYGTDGGRSNAFVMMPHVQLYGGFLGLEIRREARDWNANTTTLSGDIGIPDDHTDNVYHVVVAAGNNNYPINEHVGIDGFTITGGNGDISGNMTVNGQHISHDNGGGIYSHHAFLFLKNLRITDNKSVRGGGVYSNSSSFTLTNAQISSNEADYGGAMYNDDASPMLTNVTVAGNTANHAGGIYNSTSVAPIIRNSIIWGNGNTNVFGIVGDGSNYNIIEGLDGHHPDTNPRFADPENGNFTLSNRSSAINAGSNSAYTAVGGDLGNDRDLAGLPRVYDATIGSIGMGAFEYQGEHDPGIRYVKPEIAGGSTSGDGRSWATASSDLQAMINELTAVEGGEVWVAQGIHPAPWMSANGGFELKNNVAVYGGFVGSETDRTQRDWAHNETILHGKNYTTRVVNNGWGRADVDHTAILDGFTISDGGGMSHGHGGGIALGNASPILRNLIVKDNQASQAGGISIYGGSPLLENVQVINNIAEDRGGGIVITESTAMLRQVTVSNNEVLVSHGSGGGISLHESGAVLDGVVIRDNQVPFQGGGIDLSGYEDIAPVISNTIIVGNSAGHGGGGVSVTTNGALPLLTNVTIVGNSAGNNVGGIYSSYNNGQVILNNSVVWDNGTSLDHISTLGAGSGNNLIQGSRASDIPGNHTSLALGDIFADPDNGNYRLKAGSPAVNAGSNAKLWEALRVDENHAMPEDTGDLAWGMDMENNPRILEGRVDLGAYESPYPNIVSLSANVTPIAVDYGTAWTDVPFSDATDFKAVATLSNGTTEDVLLDENTANWVQVSPATGYNAQVAGTYTFDVPVIPRDPSDSPWFTNTDEHKVRLEITVKKGLPNLQVAWNTEAIPVSGISTVYGATGVLGISHSSTATPILTFNPAVDLLDLGDLDNVKAVQAGTGKLTVSVPATDNFEGASIEIDVVVAKADITGITFEDDTFTYDGTVKSLVISGTLPVGSGTPVYKNNGQINAGTYIVAVSINGGDNYNNWSEEATLIIEKAALTITADPQTKVYGTPDPALTYTYSGLANADGTSVFSGSLLRTGNNNVGTYKIDRGTFSAGSNYEISFMGSTFEITPAALTVTADPQTKVYGTPDPALTYTHSGLVNGDGASVFSGGLSRTGNNNVGTYKIDRGTLSAGSNYEISFMGSTFEITPAALTITADSQTKVYGTPDPALTYTHSGLVNGDGASVFSGSLLRTGSNDVGTYKIDLGGLSAGNNYEISFIGATFEITPAALTVTAESKTKVYGTSDPELTYTHSGLVNGNGASVFSGSLSRTGSENVGIYKIDLGTLSAGGNYDISFTGATLTITKASQQISFTAPGEVSLGAGILALTASSGSGLPVTLTVDDPLVATLSGHDLQLHRIGTVRITATQAGDHNHEAAEPVTVTIRVVNEALALPVRVHPAVSPNGDGVNDFLIIEGIRDYPDNQITIFDRGGNIITEIEGYDNQRNVFTGEYVRDGTYFYRLNVTVNGKRERLQGFFEVRR